MKMFIYSIVFSLISLLPLAATAGPGDACHFHGSKPASQATIIQCANDRKAALIKNGKLDKSWASIEHESVSYVDGKKGKEWKVFFVNPNAPNKTQTNLFMFFTPPGNFIAANYTGQ